MNAINVRQLSHLNLSHSSIRLSEGKIMAKVIHHDIVSLIKKVKITEFLKWVNYFFLLTSFSLFQASSFKNLPIIQKV